MTSQIIALGGGGFTQEPENPLLDLYIVGAAGKKNPRICFLPTASGDNEGYIDFFEKIFGQYPCVPTCLNVMSPRTADMEDFVLNCNVVYVGGGNTKSMLALWREWGVDKILQKAYDQGVVLAGVSAGFVCWFQECITDSIPNKYTVLPCLGLLPGSACPHYDGQPGRPAAYHRMIARYQISDGFAADDGVGLHFVDGKLFKTISSRPKAQAYRVFRENSGSTTEEVIKPEFLGDNENLQKHILSPVFEDFPSEITTDYIGSV